MNSIPKYVVSSKLEKADWNNTTIIGKGLVAGITRLKEQPGREIQIEGSVTLVQFLIEANLIDEYDYWYTRSSREKASGFLRRE